MASSPSCKPILVQHRRKGSLATNLVLYCCLIVLAALSPSAHSQETTALPAANGLVEASTVPAANTIVITKTAQRKLPVESEISVEGMIPYGDYRMFSATVRCNAWTVGVEYDRNSLGHFMGSQVDYAVEVLPVVFLSEPAISDFWGNAMSPNQQLVYGVSVLPVGFRFLWRSNKAIKPYVISKLGAAVFRKKALSQNASYVNFNIQAAFGVQIRLTERIDLRVDPFQFFHISNGYLAASNPGMDELAAKFGFTYHLGRREQ